MYNFEENTKMLYQEFKAINEVVGRYLLIENATAQQNADLAYYNRKLNEAKGKLIKNRLRKIK